MSDYQESVPKGQKLPSLREARPARQPPPESEIEYQQLIKHPPRRQAESVRSRSERETSECKAASEGEAVELGKEWLKILGLAEAGEVSEAFEAALSLDDPIYLLRLMLMSRCPLRRLTAGTVQRLWAKFLEIYSHRFIDVLTVGLLGEAQELGLLARCLSLEELEEALVALYELSGATRGKLSYRAAALYNSIERALHPH